MDGTSGTLVTCLSYARGWFEADMAIYKAAQPVLGIETDHTDCVHDFFVAEHVEYDKDLS